MALYGRLCPVDGVLEQHSQAGSSGAEVSRPPSRQWLTVAYKEVSDDDRKEFAEFLRDSLERLEENFEFERVVQALVDKWQSSARST